jgi:broad specificity phosphatase PhoE
VNRTLILLRHGQTAWNAAGRAQGQTDVPLDEVGRAQAAGAASAIATLVPVFVRSSDLARAAETADVVAAACGLPVARDPRLREYDVGERAGLTIPEFAAAFPAEHARWAGAGGSFDSADFVAGAESTSDVLARMLPALRSAFSALAPGETGVVVGHGAALRVGLLALLGWDGSASSSLRALDNCGWATVDDSALDGGLRLAAYNRIAADFTSAGSVG